MPWNKPSAKPNAKVEERKFRLYHGLIVGVIVVAVGIAAHRFFNPSQTPRHQTSKSSSVSQIRAESPAVVKKPDQAPKQVDPREMYDHDTQYRDEHGILRWRQSGCRAYDPAAKHLHVLDIRRLQRNIFTNIAERSISSLILAVPGNIRFRDPDTYKSEGFLRALKESLNTPIVINDGDSEDDRELKTQVQEIKDDLAKRIAGGEEVSQIFEDAEKELAKLREYRSNVEQMARDAIKDADGKLSEKDIHDLVSAANIMLEEKGVNPLEEDSFVTANLRLIAINAGEDPNKVIREHYEAKDMESTKDQDN